MLIRFHFRELVKVVEQLVQAIFTVTQRIRMRYWRNGEELTDKQRRIIKDLGYTYRGKNQWL